MRSTLLCPKARPTRSVALTELNLSPLDERAQRDLLWRCADWTSLPVYQQSGGIPPPREEVKTEYERIKMNGTACSTFQTRDERHRSTTAENCSKQDKRRIEWRVCLVEWMRERMNGPVTTQRTNQQVAVCLDSSTVCLKRFDGICCFGIRCNVNRSNLT